MAFLCDFMKFLVPAILVGPMDMTLDPTDPPHFATFSCTAFGTLLNISWSHTLSSAGLNSSSQTDTTNVNGSITSSISTNILSLEDDGSQYTCLVSYADQVDAQNDATGTLNLGG